MAMHGIDVVEHFSHSLSHHGEQFAIVLFFLKCNFSWKNVLTRVHKN